MSCIHMAFFAAIMVGRSRPLRAQPTVAEHGFKGTLHADPYYAARRSTPSVPTRGHGGYPPKKSFFKPLARGIGHMPGRGMRL
jgi:hypothetical protein